MLYYMLVDKTIFIHYNVDIHYPLKAGGIYERKTINNLSNDYLFKLIFSNKKYLKQFLKDCFNIEVDDFHYTKEKQTNSNKNIPVGEFDIIIETEKEIIIVEMQNKGFKSFENRVMMYAARKYSDGLKKIQKEQRKENTI